MSESSKASLLLLSGAAGGALLELEAAESLLRASWSARDVVGDGVCIIFPPPL